MKEKPINNICPNCNEDLLKISKGLSIKWDKEREILISKIPTHTCPRCREDYYDEEAMQFIQDALEKFLKDMKYT